MKKLITLACIFAAVMACNNDDSKSIGKDNNVADEKTAPAAVDNSQNPDYQKGLQLVATSDCLTCHKVDERIQGPTYREVANKYAGMTDTIVGHLAGKIIKGGSGVWGEVPMTPHPQLSEDDAKAMVKYILLLKN
ncbi:MAG: c-type cytochrome [Chitinophagaceae bacterium]|nr:c-type cytochrome [Chitinophagaceae bacterium]